MSDYFYLTDSDPKNDMGMIPIPSEEMMGAIRKIARKEGVEITDEQIINEVFGKKREGRTKSKRAKTYLYVDGTNLFVGLIQLFGLKLIPTFSSILNDINKIFKIDKTYFYASYTPFSNNKYKKYKDSVVTESKFYKEVRSIRSLTFFKGHRSPTSGKEKGVDVHLAIDVVKDAFRRQYDQAVIITGDADLVYAVEIVRLLDIPIHAIFIPNRFSRGIAHAASTASILNYKNRFNPFRLGKFSKQLKLIKIKTPARKRTG